MELPVELQQLKDRMRSTWMAGDFGRIAYYSTKIGEEFVDRLSIRPEMKVLDVACGTGNTAVPAARKGAHVTGVDIAPNLLDQARKRALAEGLTVWFDEGDAENLPYPDGRYDLVMSMFGAMFAPRPDQVTAELARVCRPGGLIAMANWTPQGFSGRMFALTARHIPPPEGIPAPVLWGDEDVVRRRLVPIASRIDTVPRTIEMEFPFPPREVVQLFRDYFGPTQVAFSRLDPSQQAAYAADLENLWREHNESGSGTTVVRNEYLEVIATRAGALGTAI
jgi:ubiquinone/menaquinone biosynthesis C-methylase UbiE